MIKYRRDIDGLRAFAILPVVLYHLGYGVFSGGYVGVDVFFVISGFLITSIIWKDIANGEFTFGSFWKRRAIRILPAMYLVLVAVLVYGWFYSAPTDYESIGRAVRQQAIFASNIFFYDSVDYFSEGLDYQPLLHMWSLAVEEQFYIVFPVICILLHKIFRLGVSALFILLCLSFVGSVWVVSDDPLGAFYFTHLRAWELLAGACLAVYLRKPYAINNTKVVEALGILGFILVVAPVFFLDHSTTFPGISALPSVIGAALLIYSGSVSDTFVKKVLSGRVFVAIGLISYSLYLWHWPVYAYFTYVYGRPDGLEQFLLLISVFGLGYFSYKYVEQPTRKAGVKASGKKVATICISLAVVLVLIGQFIRKEHGYLERLPEAAKIYAGDREWSKYQKKCSELTAERIEKGDYCSFGPQEDVAKKIIVTWGDSHNAALFPLYKELAETYKVHVKHFGKTACNLMIDGVVPDPGCKLFNDQVFRFIEENDISDVIIAARWSAAIKLESYKEDDNHYDRLGLDDYQSRFLKVSSRFNSMAEKIWLVGEVPLQKYDVAEYMTKSVMRGDETVPEDLTVAEHELRAGYTGNLLSDVAMRFSSIELLNTQDKLCSKKDCVAVINSRSLYKDDDHLSNYGALYLTELFEPVFEGE